MIDSKVCSQMAHFSLEHTHIVICGTIRGTHRLFIRWTIIHTYAPRVPGTKCLTNGKVLTGNIDARINICNMKCKEKKNFMFSFSQNKDTNFKEFIRNNKVKETIIECISKSMLLKKTSDSVFCFTTLLFLTPFNTDFLLKVAQNFREKIQIPEICQLSCCWLSENSNWPYVTNDIIFVRPLSFIIGLD